jgi:hypothetical protein
MTLPVESAAVRWCMRAGIASAFMADTGRGGVADVLEAAVK